MGTQGVGKGAKIEAIAAALLVTTAPCINTTQSTVMPLFHNITAPCTSSLQRERVPPVLRVQHCTSYQIAMQSSAEILKILKYSAWKL